MCALFGSSRDISFIKKINNELIDNIIQQEVDYYKYNLSETKGITTEEFESIENLEAAIAYHQNKIG